MIELVKNLSTDCLAKSSHVEMMNEFPWFLLDQENNEMKTITTPLKTVKFNFIMPLEEFNKSLEPMFIEQESISYVVYYVNCELMSEHDFILKLVRKHNKKELSMSIKNVVSENNLIKYKEMKKGIKQGEESCFETFTSIDVMRTIYVHKHDETVTLTLDYVTFCNDSSFVIFSIKGFQISKYYPTNKNVLNEEIKKHIKPCRSKLLEFIWRRDENVYKLLEEKQLISKTIEFQSISIAEFENGPDVAKRWEQQANELKEALIQENENCILLGEKEKYSSKYISFVYRNTLKYGRNDLKEPDLYENYY